MGEETVSVRDTRFPITSEVEYRWRMRDIRIGHDNRSGQETTALSHAYHSIIYKGVVRQ